MQIAPAFALLEISKNYADHRSRHEASWYGYTEGETWGAIPFAVSKLYRGQNTHHTPMLPSIARGLQSAGPTTKDAVVAARRSFARSDSMRLTATQTYQIDRRCSGNA